MPKSRNRIHFWRNTIQKPTAVAKLPAIRQNTNEWETQMETQMAHLSDTPSTPHNCANSSNV